MLLCVKNATAWRIRKQERGCKEGTYEEESGEQKRKDPTSKLHMHEEGTVREVAGFAAKIRHG